MCPSAACAHHRRLKAAGSCQGSKEKHDVAASAIATVQHVNNIVTALDILFLLLLLGPVALIGQVADLLCSGIEPAYLLVPVSFVTDHLLRRSFDLLVIAYEMLYILIPVASGILPEFLRAPHLPPAVV